MKKLMRGLVAVLVLTLARQSIAADPSMFMNFNGPDVMTGDGCPPPLMGTVRDSTLDCHYDYNGQVPVGREPVTGRVETFFPPRGTPSNVIPRTDLFCSVTCVVHGNFVGANCLANLSWTYIQGCKEDGDDVAQPVEKTFSGGGNEITDAAQQCRDQIGDLNAFCRENMPAAGRSTVGGNGTAEKPAKCCEETSSPTKSPTPIETPTQTPIVVETPIATPTPIETPTTYATPVAPTYESSPIPVETPIAPSSYSSTPTTTP